MFAVTKCIILNVTAANCSLQTLVDEEGVPHKISTFCISITAYDEYL